MTRIYPYEVVLPSVGTSQADWTDYARVLSRHQTAEAAQAYIDRANRQLRSEAGNERSYFDLHIVANTADGKVRVDLWAEV